MVSVTTNGLAWRQMVYHKPKWFSVAAVGLRRNPYAIQIEFGEKFPRARYSLRRSLDVQHGKKLFL